MIKPVVPIPRTVWALGFVSLFMDMSSELIHSLLPVFLVSSLGASALTVGFIEGIAEASALIVKVFSGAISDYFGRRKILLLLGYGLAALTKPLFPLATSIETVFTARFLDRIGKGIRGAPRDALIADVAKPEIRGACFGLRQSMDTVGAFLGPLVAIALLYFYDENITWVLWASVIPAAIAVLLIIVSVDEPERPQSTHAFHSPLKLNVLQNFTGRYWWVVVLGAVFTLARFSEAFLILRAQQAGLAITWVPLVLVVMSLTYALTAYPAGILSDRVNKKWLLALGLLTLILTDVILAQELTVVVAMIGVALWGLHMGLSQGVMAAMVAETAPSSLKGTAFGVFNFVSGVFMLLASIIAGWLWDSFGSSYTFYCGAIFAVLALVLLFVKKH